MNSHPLEQSVVDFQSSSSSSSHHQMAYNNNNTNNSNDLQFTTTVDTSVRQNVPIPAIVPPSQVTQPPPQPPQEGEDDTILSTLYKNSAHPIPCIFHCLFKTMALSVYILSGLLTTERFIITTVTCVVFLSMDFWVVKNVTGRLLVGLRWWSQNVGEDGTEHKWIFESHEGSSKTVNKFDNTLFWTVLYATPVIWIVFFLSSLLRFDWKWLITVFFGIALSSANTYGYYQCSKDQKAKWERMMVRGAEISAFSAIRNSQTLSRFGDFATRLVGFGTSSSSSNAAAAGSGASYANVNPGGGQGQQQQQIPPSYGQPLQHV